MKKCSECDFAILVEFGYSNYTVEGTTVHCSKQLNPNGSFDRWYGEDKRDVFAEQCGSFQAQSKPAIVDVDRENIPFEVPLEDYEKDKTWEPYATKFVSAEALRMIWVNTQKKAPG